MSSAIATLGSVRCEAPETPLAIRARQAGRIAGFCAILMAGMTEHLLLRTFGKMAKPLDRALWLQRVSRRLMRCIGLHAHYVGEREEAGLFVFNHVSYLDIVTLAARDPIVFVAKCEVRTWPVIGWIAAAAGTLFIDRTKRTDVARVGAAMKDLLSDGLRVCIFPEGTSSDGTSVLPFRTSLIEPAIEQKEPVTAGWIGYELEDGEPETEVCYWGDLTFGPHLLNLFTKRQIFATVGCARAGMTGECRKAAGKHLHGLVCRLAEQHA